MDKSRSREGRRFTWIYPILEKEEGFLGYIPYLRRENLYMELSHTREGRRFTWTYHILEKGEGLHVDIPILEKGEGLHEYTPY